MIPVFYPGDRVLTFNWTVPKKGDVVVFKKVSTNFIKRLIRAKDNIFFLRGDNKHNSRIVYKTVLDHIIGKVILKY